VPRGLPRGLHPGVDDLLARALTLLVAPQHRQEAVRVDLADEEAQGEGFAIGVVEGAVQHHRGAAVGAAPLQAHEARGAGVGPGALVLLQGPVVGEEAHAFGAADLVGAVLLLEEAAPQDHLQLRLAGELGPGGAGGGEVAGDGGVGALPPGEAAVLRAGHGHALEGVQALLGQLLRGRELGAEGRYGEDQQKEGAVHGGLQEGHGISPISRRRCSRKAWAVMGSKSFGSPGALRPSGQSSSTSGRGWQKKGME